MCNIPYTYLLGWPKFNKWYYGVRYSKNCNPNDLWNPYKSSSIYVKKFIMTYGNPTIIQHRKIFTSIHAAREWEHKVLRRLKVSLKENWLNKTHNKSRPPLYGNDNPATREDVRKLISKNTPRKMGDTNPMRNPATAKKVSEKLRGRINYWQLGELNPAKRPEIRKKLSKPGKLNPFYGKTHSEQCKIKIGSLHRGIPKEKIQCPYCNVIGGKNVMGRWHFNKCSAREKLNGSYNTA